jgi:hypothetical protein
MKRLILLFFAVSLVLAGCSNSGNNITGAAVGAPCECSDSDGLNPNTAGITIMNSDGKKITRHDQCIANFVKEYYCEDSQIKTQNFRCENTCAEGACQ